MAEIQLTDLVLLSTKFSMWPDPPVATPDDHSSPFTYPEGNFLTLAAATERDDRGLVLYLQADLDDRALPFTLSVLLAGRFEVTDAGERSDDLVRTLVWHCYPLLRKLVASLTGWSPLPPYNLPLQT